MEFLLRQSLLGMFLIHAFLTPAFAETECLQKLYDLIEYRPVITTPEEAAARAIAPEATRVIDEAEETAEEVSNALLANRAANAAAGKYKLIIDPKEALAARILMIRNATDTIDISYYIFKDTEASRVILGELKNALRRGVNVRLMVDGSGSVLSSLKAYPEIQTLMNVKGGLRANGVRATFDPVVINPLFNVRANVRNWYQGVVKLVTGKDVPVEHFSMFQRSHDKILLVDSAIPEKSMALIGGRNISNDYYGIGSGSKDTYNDLDILMKGVSTARETGDGIVIENAISDHYNRLYNLAANKRFNDFFLKIGRSKAAENLNKIRNQMNTYSGHRSGQLRPVLDRMKSENYLEEGFDEGQIAILNEFENIQRQNPLKQKHNLYTSPNSIMKNMWDQLAVARKDILIGTPYLYLTDNEIARLVKWLKEDPSRKLRIMTNSTATSDNLPAQAMMEHFVMPKLRTALDEAGVPSQQYEIMAYGNRNHRSLGGSDSQGKLHAKFWMVDNQVIGAGTSNFDPISRLTNSEIMANVFPEKGTASVESLNRFYDDLKARSTYWGSEEFNAVKSSPELKNRIRAQAVIAKILRRMNLLPQD